MALIIIKATYPMTKLDEVENIWLNEMFKEAPFEPFEKVVVCDASIVREGNIAEVLNIVHVDGKRPQKQKD